ncbi:exported hypothetical protein [Candidatus Zixiibacteriota bacterium]|nr:exported hypothetical protein [candidate division Zixibacteria bacterium]
MRKRISFFLIFAAMSLISCSVRAGVFVDWQADFYVTYPDDWQQVPYSSVSVYLQSQGIDPKTLNFDGALSQKSDKPFFMGPHMFIAHYPVGRLNQRQIDSVLAEMTAASESGKYVEGSLSAPKVQFYEKQPLYDRAMNAVAVATFLKAPGVDMITLEVRKFYEKGVAVFIGYGPRENYNDIQPIFLNIIKSFSTKDLDKVAPKESLKVVDLANRQMPEPTDLQKAGGGKEGGFGRSSTLILIIVLVIAVIVVAWFLARKKKSSKSL